MILFYAEKHIPQMRSLSRNKGGYRGGNDDNRIKVQFSLCAFFVVVSLSLSYFFRRLFSGGFRREFWKSGSGLSGAEESFLFCAG
jgi:hypothetical protein